MDSSPSSSNITCQAATEPSVDVAMPVCWVDLGVICTVIAFSKPERIPQFDSSPINFARITRDRIMAARASLRIVPLAPGLVDSRSRSPREPSRADRGNPGADGVNFIFFDDPIRFEQSADRLAKALN